MLTIKQATIDISLPSGPKATIGELVGRHQRILTESRIPIAQRFNRLLCDIIKDIAGSDWTKKTDLQRRDFVQQMLSPDRKAILGEARQLAKSHSPTFEFRHDYKDGTGVKRSELFEIILIDKDNRESQIESIAIEFEFVKDYENKEEWTDEERESVDFIRKLNREGCFPTRPLRNRYDTYSDVLQNKDIEFLGEGKLNGLKFKFRMLDGYLEEKVDLKSASSHTKILTRKLRYQEKKKEGDWDGKWKKIDSKDLDNLPIDSLDQLRNKMTYYEGEVDTVETFDNPDQSKNDKVSIDLMAEISFFFPSGKV